MKPEEEKKIPHFCICRNLGSIAKLSRWPNLNDSTKSLIFSFPVPIPQDRKGEMEAMQE
jgi:hypothetical protein